MPTRIAKHMLYYVLLTFVGLAIYLALSGHAQAAETAVTASQTLTASLVDIIQQVSGGVKQGVSFLQQEIPDVIKQLLVWKMVKALFFVMLSLVLAAIATKLIYVGISGRTEQKSKSYYDREESAYVLPWTGAVFTYSISGMIFLINTLEALQIYIAPKVWLIEYAASLVK